MSAISKTKAISTFVLVMFITGAIDSIRNLPATALFGHSLIFFFALSACIFLIPAALISAELTSAWPHESGVYHWVRHAFGERIGFLAIWLQWINTMVWYPTILSFIAATIAYLIDPTLSENKLYLVSIILCTFWLLTFLNLRGVQTSARFASVCAVIGMIIPMALIIVLALIWLGEGRPLQVHITRHNIIPDLMHVHSWASLTAMVTAYLGIELATVHINKVEQPRKTFPKAMFYSTVIILTTMCLGSLAIAFVIPSKQISLVQGVMDSFNQFFHAYHLTWLTPVLTVMLIVGSVGGMINWIISPAQGLLQAAQHDFMPKFLQYENRHGAASRLLILQAVLVSLSCAAFLFMPTVNSSYWLLTDLSTQLYVIMYVILFCAAVRQRYLFPNLDRLFEIPGKKLGILIVAGLGLIGCALTLVVGFFPPSMLNVGGLLHYDIVFAAGLLILIFPVVFFYWYQKKRSAEKI